MNHYFLLTIDVEDWFQVENFKKYIPFASWPSYELRVEKNTHRLLDLFDSASFKFQVSSFKINATFFVLGWLAERMPNLVQEIHSRGHEVASHGYYHNLCNEQSHEDLKTDLCDSKSLLEDIIGAQVYGYRAPSFAINNDILKIIEDCGYLYDSSYNSFALHGRYGQIDLPQNMKNGIAAKISDDFYELPISNLRFRTPFSYARPARPVAPGDGTGVKFFKKDSTVYPVKSESHLTGADLTGALSLPRETRSMFHWGAISSEQNRGGFVLPWGGGGYFRMIPFPFFRWGVNLILKKEKAYLLYIHPWEIDPDQPVVKKASRFYKFRHYTNLKKTLPRLLTLIESCQGAPFLTCQQYLEESIGLTTRVSKSQETQSS